MWRHKIRKIAVESLQSENNRTQRLREILRMVIIDTVINSLLGRLTLDPAGMHCPSWDDAFVSSLFVNLFVYLFCCLVVYLFSCLFIYSFVHSLIYLLNIYSHLNVLDHCNFRLIKQF